MPERTGDWRIIGLMERLLDYFIPENYQLDLFIDKENKFLKGVVKITGKALTPTIKLHSVNNKIKTDKINGEKVNFKTEDGVLSVNNAPRGDLTLEVGYDRTLNENMQGAYLSTYEYQGETEKIVSTQFESHYAREAFPCIDEPAAKATFDLSITIPDEGDIVISNTELKSAGESIGLVSGEDNATARRFSFVQTPRMSTYLLAFVIGKFNFVETKTASGITVRTYAPLNQSKDLLSLPNEIAKKSLDYYENLFSSPYPLKKLDQVAIPDFEAGAMENWGIVTYRMSQLLCNEHSAISSKKAVALTITHELSHQWFGNLVTMSWWDGLWLNESFASVMEYFCTDYLFPTFRVWADFFTSDCLAALYRDAIPDVQSVQEDVSDPAEIATLFDPCIVYAKGAHLMLMLIREMGEKNFFRGIKDYFEKFKYKNTSGDDLWNVLNSYSSFDVKEFMDAWILKSGFPVITDEAQQRFFLDGSTDDSVYPIPEVKDDMSGHYLINLSGPEFREALDNFNNLSEEQRLRLLIDRMLLAETPLVASSSLLPLIEKFKSETSAPIWGIIEDIIYKLTLFIDYDSPEEEKYKRYIFNIIKTPLERLGLLPRKDETLNDTELRSFLLSAGVYSKAPELIDQLADLYDKNFQSLNPETRPFILSAKLWRDEAEIYSELIDLYKDATDPDLKADLRVALAKPRLPKNIDFAFSCLKNPEIIKPQDHLSFFLFLRRWKYTRDRALSWLFENWDYIYKINGEKSVEDYPRYLAKTIDKREDAERFFEFFEDKKDIPVLSRTLKIAKNDIESTLKLIEMDKKSVLAAINKLECKN